MKKLINPENAHEFSALRADNLQKSDNQVVEIRHLTLTGINSISTLRSKDFANIRVNLHEADTTFGVVSPDITRHY